jgi:hypothetical protein
MVENRTKQMTDEEALCTFQKMSESFFHELEKNTELYAECVHLYGELPFMKRVIKELNPKNALELYYTVNTEDEELTKGMMNLLGTVLEIMRD